MSEDAVTDIIPKKQLRKTLDISDIEKSIDAFLAEKTQQKSTPKPPQKTPYQPSSNKENPTYDNRPDTETAKDTSEKSKTTLEIPKDLLTPKYDIPTKPRTTDTFEKIPLPPLEPIETTDHKTSSNQETKQPPKEPPLNSNYTMEPTIQKIPLPEKEPTKPTDTTINEPVKEYETIPPKDTTTPIQKEHPDTITYPHPQDKKDQPTLDITHYTPGETERPSMYTIKNKPIQKEKKPSHKFPVFSLLFKKTTKEKTIKTEPTAYTEETPKPPTTQFIDTLPPKKTSEKHQTHTHLFTRKEPEKKQTLDQPHTTGKKPTFSNLPFSKPKKKKDTKDQTIEKTPSLPQPTNQYLAPSATTKPHPELHESLQQLSTDESNWLDQKIKETKPPKTSKQYNPTQQFNPQEQLLTQISAGTLKKGKPPKPSILKGLSRHKNQHISLSNEKRSINFFKSQESPRPPSISQTNTQYMPSKRFPNPFQKRQTPTSQIPFTFQDQEPKTFKELFVKPKEPTKNIDQPISATPEISLPESKPRPKNLNDIKQIKAHLLQELGYTEDTCEELDFYPLIEPFAYVEIIREKKTLDKQYVLIEIELTDTEHEILQFIRDSLNSINVDAKELELKGDHEYLKGQVEQIIDDYMLKLDETTKKKIIFYIEKQFLGLEKLEVLMRDPNIEDISCDGSRVPIFLYHRRYGSLRSNVEFDTEEELASFVIKLAQKCGKHISIAEPMLDATMPDGSRIQMTLSTEITTKGSTFTIRKFMEDPFSPPDLIEFNTMSSEMVAYMWMAVENGINALIAGGTASGKTSALNALALFIPRESKIVSIEETREINLPHPNWIPGVSRSGFGEVVGNKIMGEIDLYDLMKAALRQRPEYIIVGEIRGREAYVLFQAMATGHTTYSTVHADSAPSLIHRLEGKPINIPRIMLQALDIVCIQVISRVKDKRARRCKQIIEIIDIDPATKEILTNEVFHWDPVEDKFIYSGKSYVLERIRAEKDFSRDQMTKELHDRAHLLDWMNGQNIREFKKVATLVAQYVDNPKEIMKKIS